MVRSHQMFSAPGGVYQAGGGRHAQIKSPGGLRMPKPVKLGDQIVAPHWSQYLGEALRNVSGQYMEHRAEQEEQQQVSGVVQALRNRAPGTSTADALSALEDNPYAAKLALEQQLEQPAQPDWQDAEINTPEGVQRGVIDMNSPQPESTFRPLGEAVAEEPDQTSDMQEYQFAQQQGFPGSFMDYQTAKAEAGADRTDITLPGNEYDDDFYKNLSKGSADDFRELQIGAAGAADSLRANQTARELLDSGMITGAGANWIVGAGKVLQQAGFNEFADPIANTEAYAASRAQEVAQIIKQFGAGTGLSDKDREFAEKAAAGEITMTEQSMRRILEINDEASRNIINNYNEKLERLDPEKIPAYYGPVEIPGSNLGGEAPEGIDPGDWKHMTAEERRLFQ